MNDQFELIADGLAENGYAVIDHFLSNPEVDSILELGLFNHDSLQQFKKAGIGKQQGHQINESIRGDFIQWLDAKTAPTPVRVYLDRLTELETFLNQSLYLGLKAQEVHMTVYPVGSFYKRHLDQFKADSHRKLSVICYLNHGWTDNDGGHLRMFLPQGTLDFAPVAGRLICFRSELIEHEVLPSRRERISLTGWLLDQPLDMRF